VTLPKHLEPLLDGTPLAVERIKHAWPGLSTSDRAYLLAILLADTSKERKAIRWSHHRKQLVDLALADENAYIRYLAAKDVSAPLKKNDDDDSPAYLDEMTRFKKVKSDPVALVRLANEEDGWKGLMRELDDAESFWKRPQVERLTLVKGVKENGEEIAGLLRYAAKDLLQTNAVTLEEMLDVLFQYLGGKSIAERVADSEDYAHRFYDGYAEYSAGNSVKALWEVIPDVPKALSYVLLECLPEEAGFKTSIPPQVIDSLDEHQLEHLLWRNDITLKELRRKLYKESANDSLRRAAVASQRFALLDSDISRLVYNPGEPPESGEKKVNELAMLAQNCRGATLVQMQAICDLINDAPTTFHSGLSRGDAIGFGQIFQTERAKRLSPSALQDEVFALRLFALAKELAPIEGGEKSENLPKKLKQHHDKVVLHNPWQTYLNLAKVVRLDRWREAVDYLPSVSIQDFDLPNNNLEESEDDEDHDRRQLFDLLKDVQGRVKDVSEQDRAALSALSKALSTLSNQLVNVKTVTGKRVEALQSRIEELTRAVNILLWVAGAIFLFVLFNGSSSAFKTVSPF